MRIAIVNEAKRDAFRHEDIAAIANVLELQTMHYAEFWQSGPTPIQAFEHLGDVPKDAAIIALLEDADQAGVLGYHDVTPDGRPYGRVFLGPILNNGGDWVRGSLSVSQTLSHEVLETIGDPYANWWAGTAQGYQRAIELCDLVESDTYEIEGISVSNFLGPRAFDATKRAPGPWDWMGVLKSGNDEPRPDCYEIRQAISGTAYPVFGASYPEWKKAMKAGQGGRTANRLGLYHPYGCSEAARYNDLTIIGDEVPDEHAIELKKLCRYAKGITESVPPFERPKAQPLFNGTLMSLVGRR